MEMRNIVSSLSSTTLRRPGSFLTGSGIQDDQGRRMYDVLRKRNRSRRKREAMVVVMVVVVVMVMVVVMVVVVVVVVVVAVAAAAQANHVILETRLTT